MIGSELNVKPEKCVAARGSCSDRLSRTPGGRPAGGELVLVWNFADGRLGIANGPGGVIERG